ncbi:MAG TPA: hypothetical protein VM260_24405 [Pirellula sp.]|nr:hypothetical protein [Pirellula sp.]
MKFFVPDAEDDGQAERVFEATREFCGFENQNQKIDRIDYVHNGQQMAASIGGQPDAYYRELGPVLVILYRPGLFAVCLQDRGVVRGEPILVGEASVQHVVHFDPPAV